MYEDNNYAHITTVADFLEWCSAHFESQDLYYGHGTDNPWDEAVNLVLYVLQLPADTDDSVLSIELSAAQKKQLLDMAQRRVQERIPVPYLTNEAWFAGERYYINDEVIIPRSPLAELIANQFQPWLGAQQPKNILDLCTGSGCLAIYTAKQFPAAQVDALDISDAALSVARKNVALHNCADRVHVIKSDLFSAVNGKVYDIILSNPPYVATDEMRELPPEYLHEPDLALHSGADGLDITRCILREAQHYLSADGLLIVEVGNSWQALQEAFPKVPFTWLEFANGGDGVFLLTAAELRECKFE
jgi:ribosomal protein L3 glutamine methyltransferase